MSEAKPKPGQKLLSLIAVIALIFTAAEAASTNHKLLAIVTSFMVLLNVAVLRSREGRSVTISIYMNFANAAIAFLIFAILLPEGRSLLPLIWFLVGLIFLVATYIAVRKRKGTRASP